MSRSSFHPLFAGLFLLAAGAAHADPLEIAAPPQRTWFAGPVLLDLSLGFGFEPHDRAPAMCSHRPSPTAQDRNPAVVSNPQCNLVLAFGVGAEALWRGFVGAAVGLYAAEGSPVQVVDAPSFGDRVSATVAVAIRPLAPLAWKHGDGFVWRLFAGFGLQAGLSIELARTSLDQQTTVGFHGEALLDFPVYGSNTTGGLALRLSSRLLVTREAKLAFDANKGVYQVDEPGTALQLLFGIAYYL